MLGLTGCSSETAAPPDDPHVTFDVRWSDKGALRDARLVWYGHTLPSMSDTLTANIPLEDGATSLQIERTFPPSAAYRLHFEVLGALARSTGWTESARLFHADTTLTDLEPFDRLEIAMDLHPLVPRPQLDTTPDGDNYRVYWIRFREPPSMRSRNGNSRRAPSASP